MTLLTLWYIGFHAPFHDFKSNFNESFNEICLVFCIYIIMVFMMTVVTTEFDTMTWAFIIIVAINVLFFVVQIAAALKFIVYEMICKCFSACSKKTGCCYKKRRCWFCCYCCTKKTNEDEEEKESSMLDEDRILPQFIDKWIEQHLWTP